jgi:thiol:disulfide interchange protein
VVAVVVAVLVLGFVIPFVLVTSGGGHSHPKSAPAQQS